MLPTAWDLSSAGGPRRTDFPESSPSPPRSTMLAGKRVVIVEDEAITQFQIRRILTMLGMQVVAAAGNGPDAVLWTLKERPDIVLMDINMPGAYDGLEAARRILEQFYTCIVMLTAYEDYRDKALAIGACGYVLKPIDSTALLPKLEEAFKAFRPQ